MSRRAWTAVARLAITILLIWLVAACETVQDAPPADDPSSPTNPRPEGSPDVVVLSFSGRCNSLNLSCVPPFDNHTYLENASHLARQAVVGAFQSLGLSVGYADVSAFVAEHYSYVSGVYEPGYSDVDRLLEQIKREWIADFDNPTRVVLMAHSHGTVWASLLAWNHLDVTFDYFISLDGICTWWEADNLKNNTLVQDYYSALGKPLPWPINEAGGVCDLAFSGLSGYRDINDLVPWNVTYGLEVQSENSTSNGNYVWDREINVRLDGSGDFIAIIEPIGEDHGDVAKAGSAAMGWVTQMIQSLGLPSFELTSMSGQNAAPMPRVPAPPGYRYAQ